MKNLMRMLVVTLILAGSTLASAATNGLTGPGTEPPPPIAGVGICGQITFSGPGTPAEPPVAVIL